MFRTATFVLAAAAMALYACGDDTETGCTPECVGEQIRECNDDGTLAEATDCPEGEMCSTGHEGMDYVHCMAPDHDNMDHSDHE